MDAMKWEVWPEPWFGYTVVLCISRDAFGSAFRRSRNRFWLPKFFFTEAGAQAWADELNYEVKQP